MRKPSPIHMAKVIGRLDHCAGLSSVFLEAPRRLIEGYNPGQFVMVWVPGVDEVPMSLSHIDEDRCSVGITVQDIGKGTGSLCRAEKGDLLGIRGPFGRGFRPSEGVERLIGLSGGVGAASIVLAMERFPTEGMSVTILHGARSSDLLLYMDRWSSLTDDVVVSTDDGTAGHRGFVTDLLYGLSESMTMKEKKRAEVICCGPEAMMKRASDMIARTGIRGQFSLERYMKCGIGLCDSCSVSGRRVCTDGPVFDIGELDSMKEFGSFKRDRAGRRVPLEERI